MAASAAPASDLPGYRPGTCACIGIPEVQTFGGTTRISAWSFLPFAEVIALPTPWLDLPVCRDENDQVFLVLAHFGEADALVTGGSDILAMRNVFQGHIITVDELAAQMNPAK